jgi:glycine hydroxymethyltransferase
MSFSAVQSSDLDIYNLILAEQTRQSEGMEFIASENYQSAAVLEAQSSVFANKYSEGTPWRRYYWWQENTDQIEQIAIDRAKLLFHADHANVQPLSWAAANICAYNAMMDPGDTIMWMDLSHGWHLTHGNPMTLSSKIYNFVTYKTLPDGSIDYDALARTAKEVKPKVILAGFSAYPRELDYSKFSQIANDVWAYAYADMAHISGFIAAGLLANPLDNGFHAMMTTTHKSLRWPRGAMVLSKGIVSNPLKAPERTMENLPTLIDRSVFPGVQWWPHMQTIAAIAIALKEAQSDWFREYARQSLLNAKKMAEEFLSLWYHLVTGGTDNHMIVVDFANSNVTELLWFDGTRAEKALDKIGISTSKSTIPDDPNPPFRPSGLRIGTPPMTTRGMKEEHIVNVVRIMHQAFIHADDDAYLSQLRQQVIDMSKHFPVPSL